MKLHPTLFLLALLIYSPLLRAEGDTPLEKQMQTLARGTKQLSLQMADPSKQEETITLLESLKKAAIDSEGLEPRKTASIPTADHAQFLIAYKAQMDKLANAFSQIEDAVKASQYDKAKSLFATVQGIKKDGHSKFKQD